MDGNPLLAVGAAPAFDRIRPEHVEPAIRELLAKLESGIAAHEAALPRAPATYAERVAAPALLGEPLRQAWGAVKHLTAVRDEPALPTAHDAVQPAVVATQLRIDQSLPMYQSVRALDGAAPALPEVEARVIRASRLQAEFAGVALDTSSQARFRALALEHDQLCQRFRNQLLDATAAAAITLADPAEVEGLPAAVRARTAAAASGDPERGPWKISLDFATYGPFLEHARHRASRERLYRAMVSRASAAPNDNLPVLERILAIRQEQARLLGYANYAAMSLATKMASSVEAIEALHARLAEAARPRARAEHEELERLARARGAPALALWDIPFWAERLREERYAIRDEEVRPYFSLARVLQGLFALVERLFAVRIVPADGEVPVWEPTVRYFRVLERGGEPIAAFYLDPYARPGTKQDGAWMDVCLDRRVRADRTVRLPVAYLVCNQTPPSGELPSLMSFREVTTLFHELGHGLQHMLTRVDRTEAAGINNVEWDAVELPSQFMENWCYHRETLTGMARHWQTAEPMDPGLVDRLISTRTFRAGTLTMRQVLFGRLDLALHQDPALAAPGAALALMRRLTAEHAVLTPLPEDRWLCGFSHIFPGGYAAGYYSYKWAEVLSADAFAAFAEAGLADQAALARLGARFRDTVLGLGGGRHPLAVFRDFRGREPSAEPLIRQLGFAAA